LTRLQSLSNNDRAPIQTFTRKDASDRQKGLSLFTAAPYVALRASVVQRMSIRHFDRSSVEMKSRQ